MKICRDLVFARERCLLVLDVLFGPALVGLVPRFVPCCFGFAGRFFGFERKVVFALKRCLLILDVLFGAASGSQSRLISFRAAQRLVPCCFGFAGRLLLRFGLEPRPVPVPFLVIPNLVIPNVVRQI